MSERKKLDRREFLRMAAIGAAGTLLGACGTPAAQTTVETTNAVEATDAVPVASGGGKEVRFLTETWNWEKLNMANATDHYNQELRAANSDVSIVVDPAPDGWDTKVVQMIKDNELLWNGHLRSTNTGGINQNYKLGILAPWDDLINASSVPWAGKFWDELLPNIRDSFTIDGKLYAMPWDGEVFVRVYNKPLWDAIGETPAETLDDFEAQLEELKKAHPDKIPMCLRHHPGTGDQHMLMQLWTDDPWTHDENGSYLDVKSEAYAEYLKMIKRWHEKGLITDDSWGGTMYDSWNTGNTCTGQSGAAWLMATSQKVWGTTNIIPTTNFVLKAGDKPKTLTYANGAMLFKGAQYPQEVADWLLWMLDPTVEKVANYSFIRGLLNYYHIPMYQSIYDNILPTDTSWAWMMDMLEMIKASTLIPPDAFASVIFPLVNVWEEKFVHGEVGLDEAVDGMYDEFMEAIQKSLDA